MASNNKAKNIKGLFTNPKTRVGIVVVGGILLGCVAFGLMRANSNNNKPLPAQAGANIPTAPVVNTTPGSSNDPNYNALVGQDNAAKIDQAEKSGTSVLPVLTKNTNIDKTDPFDNLNKDKVEKPVETPEPVAPPVMQPAPVVQQPVMQPVQIQQPQVQQAPMDTQSMQNMSNQLAIYMKSWQANPGYQEISYAQPPTQQGQGQQVNNNGQANLGGQQQQAPNSTQASQNSVASVSKNTKQGAAFVRAGTIVPGVMLTALNSDEPGPVLVEIVSGPLKGARMIGEMQASNQTITVSMSKLSMPGANQTFSTSSYLVDPNTSRTGIATDVNNHYFLRYGLQLAAAFITGYGEAVQNMGAVTTTSALGGTTTTYPSLSHKQIGESALGEVGQTLGQNLRQDSNKAPTVSVASGTPVGILFMADF